VFVIVGKCRVALQCKDLYLKSLRNRNRSQGVVIELHIVVECNSSTAAVVNTERRLLH